MHAGLEGERMSCMSQTAQSRAAQIADQFESAQEAFIRLVESLTDEQWGRVGRNGPERLNDEDEGRTVGVIAHHVAMSGPFIIDRIRAMLAGRQMTPVDIHAMNAAHAAEHAMSRGRRLRASCAGPWRRSPGR
jgi:hypothetical protein